MNKSVTLLLIAILGFHFPTVSQDFSVLNNLPPTLEVDATEFNTVKKYYFQVDSLQNRLIIQDVRSSKNGLIHYYQWLYEIPLSSLSSASFRVAKNHFNQARLEITTPDNAITTYKFIDSKVSNINTSSRIVLGDWSNDTPVESELTSMIALISENFSTGNSEVVDLTRLKKPRPSLFRSIEKSTSKTYRDLSATDSFISFSKNKTFKPIIKEIKKLMKSKKSRLPIPVFVYTDDDGAFESIYIHHNLTDAESLNLSKYTDLVINKTVKQKSAAKYVFLLKN